MGKTTVQPDTQFQAFRECSPHNERAFSGIKIKMHVKLKILQNPYVLELARLTAEKQKTFFTERINTGSVLPQFLESCC